MTKRVIATAGPLPNLKNLRGMPRYPRPCARLPEKNIAQMRETYERSKDALENVMQSWEKSFDAADSGSRGPKPKDHRHCPAQHQFKFRSCEEPCGGKKPSRERLWRCNQPIGASSSTHSRPWPKRCEHTIDSGGCDAAKSIEGGIHKMK